MSRLMQEAGPRTRRFGRARATRYALPREVFGGGEADVNRMIRLDAFGDLIGNTDRYFGNVSFFAEESRELNLILTPVYDMLPMVFAPAGAIVVERPFAPGPPNALNLEVWPAMAELARTYWSRVCEADGLGEGFRSMAVECRGAVSRLLETHG